MANFRYVANFRFFTLIEIANFIIILPGHYVGGCLILSIFAYGKNGCQRNLGGSLKLDQVKSLDKAIHGIFLLLVTICFLLKRKIK